MILAPPTTQTEIALLATSHRNGLVENRHWGWLAISEGDGTPLYSTPGSHKATIFLRSAAKPFQAMPLVQSGCHQELTSEDLAIACSSHIGSPYHVQQVTSLLKKAGLNEEHLACGPHLPICTESAQQLLQQGKTPRRLHNNCSGKHAGMLYYCVQHHLPLEDYLNPLHPLQERISKTIQHYASIETTLQTGIDGCGSPTHYLPLLKAAQLYANLGSQPECEPIVNAMTAHPKTMGGLGRVDTAIITASGGKLLAKVGADGVIGISRIHKNQGLILKVADGNTDIRNQIIIAMLKKIKWLSPLEERHPLLKPFQALAYTNTKNQIVGEVKILLSE